MIDDTSPGGFEAALRHLGDRVLDGTWRAGDRLPTERELASELGISRQAVREALKVLQAQGIITSVTGPAGGTRISTSQGPAFGRILRLHLALQTTSAHEVTATRIVLEREAARLAAGAGPERLAGLTEILARMAAVTDAREFNDLDTQFHVAIAEAGANRLVRDFTVAIREAVAVTIHRAEDELGDWDTFRNSLLADHRSIHAALVAGDGDLAAQRVEDHIRRAHEVLLPAQEPSPVLP